MKNIKNTLVAAALTVGLGFGATAAHAGLLVSDRTIAGQQPTCGTKADGGILAQATGILIVGFSDTVANGILIVGKGLLVSDKGLLVSDKGCTENVNGGLLVSD